MRSLDDDFFKSMIINNPEKIHGGSTVMTTMICQIRNHIAIDGECEDSEQIHEP